jgi:CheY-like chemotaxis protein
VLIIEDDPVIALDLRGQAERMGLSVCGTAATQTEAVARARECAPDLILADIRLRKGDGVAAVQEILEDQTPAVVYVTAPPEALIGRGRDRPFVVRKPFSPQLLRETIDAALRRKV